MTALYGNGQRSEWRYRLTPEELRALEEREQPRIAAGRARREARRQDNRDDHELEQLAAYVEHVTEVRQRRAQKYIDNNKLCGGKTRKDGTPCRSVAIRPNGRCMWHGGLSTGPKTEEGKRRCLEGRLRQLAADRAAGIKRTHKKTPEGRANIAAAIRRRALLRKLEQLASVGM
jgi:hypothetical protein